MKGTGLWMVAYSSTDYGSSIDSAMLDENYNVSWWIQIQDLQEPEAPTSSESWKGP